LGGWLLVNPRSGPDSGVQELVAAAAARGVETHVLGEGEDAAALAREAQADVLGVAGGDGSLAPVAEAAIARDLPFVCVPVGTRNHFARDLGLDRADPLGALAGFDGIERRVDVGRANGRLFLNNVSIGAYAVLVHHGWRRALDSLRFRQRLTVDGEPVHTRVLLIGNNAYTMTGSRERLDEGLLHLYTPSGELRTASRAAVGAHRKRVRAAIDGERVVLSTPIELAIEPAALRVLAPRGPVAQ
jgi:diacylglycerol kinase family enzyme